MSGSKIIFILSGSIACAKACDVVSRLVQDGHQVRLVATASALRFVGAPMLEGLTGQPVLSELFAPGAALDHITLTRWADAVMVCPATAGLINRLAAGLADDLPGALFLAHDRTKPWLVVPAMNPAMWSHPATLAAVRTLQGWGVSVLPVAAGRTACGENGEGRMIEPDRIVREIARRLSQPARRMRVLITSGGTAEPLDSVRFLTNGSTGRTGAILAEHFYRTGHEVLLLRANSAVSAQAPVREQVFGSYAELDHALGQVLGAEDFEVVIHAAAVSDYGIAAVMADGQSVGGAGKIDSQGGLTVQLRPLPKLIDQLRARSRNPALTVVGFKLTSGANPTEVAKAVQRLLDRGVADFVVHNDLSDQAPDPGQFPSEIYSAAGDRLRCPTRAAMATELERLLSLT